MDGTEQCLAIHIRITVLVNEEVASASRTDATLKIEKNQFATTNFEDVGISGTLKIPS
jgi:hypothetical protein